MLDGRCLMLENKWLKAHGTWLKVKDCDPGYHQEENVIIKTLTVGPIMANCFVVGCEETLESAVIDPGDEPDRILQALAESNLTAKLIINTHGHFDHVGANKRLKEVTSAPILIHPFDAPMLNQLADSAAAWGMAADNSPPPDRELQDGDEVAFGKIILKVLHTPGTHRAGFRYIRTMRFLLVIHYLRDQSVALIFRVAASRHSRRVFSKNCLR